MSNENDIIKRAITKWHSNTETPNRETPLSAQEVAMSTAKMFAQVLLDAAEAGSDKKTSHLSDTEKIARDVEENGNEHDRFRRGVPDATNEEIDRATALSDFAQETNESASFDGEERFPNAFDIEDIVNRLAAAVRERRR